MSNRALTLTDLRQHVASAEAELVNLNRRLTEAIVAKRPTGTLSADIQQTAEARDFFRARLACMEGKSDG